MKKLVGLLIAVIIVAGCFSIGAYAEEKRGNVYFTLSDSTGKIIFAQEKITVVDKNSDGKFNVDEVLFAAHEAKYTGGAAAGYASAVTQYGLGATKIWGDTSGNFGYCVNDKMSNGLSDEVKDGDYVNAYINQKMEFDPITYEMDADCYSFFDKKNIDATPGQNITVTLTTIQYDADFQPVNIPAVNAIVTLNGTETQYKTDANGKVTFTIDNEGEYLVSAIGDDPMLVPPVLKVTVKSAETTAQVTSSNVSKSPKTGDTTFVLLTIFAIIGLAGMMITVKQYEK